MSTSSPTSTSSAAPRPPAPAGTPTSGPTTAAVGTVASLALAVTVLLAYLVTGGAPNPGMAALAVVPLLAAWAFRSGRRWAPLAALASAALVLGLRTTELSFDLGRPGAVVPFVVAATTVTTAGIVLAVALLHLTVGSRAAARTAALATAAGVGLGVLVATGLLLGTPQQDRTGDLTAAQVAALPTVEMVNYKFEPGQLRVAAGQPVAFRFTNDTDDAHAFTVDAFDVDVVVPSGRSRVVVVEAAPGTYPYHCSVGSHEEDGMKGRLVVVGEDGAGHAGHDHAAHEGHDHAH